MSRCWAGFITVLMLALCAPQADATVLFSASGGGLSAKASFSISGSYNNRLLTILLTNTDSATGANAPLVPSQVLTGLFFNLGTSAFTPVSATLVDGGHIIQTENCDAAACAGKSNVGGEFSYASGGASWLPGTNQGIASSGYLNANTSEGNFPGGTNYDNPKALDGINFGIVPAGWAPYSGNGGLDKVALVDGTVKFVLKVPKTLSESDISNVNFTYGTKPNEGTLHAPPSGTGSSVTTTNGTVPEPAMLSVLGVALTGLGYRMRKRRP
jgi:hypothetical protein